MIRINTIYNTKHAISKYKDHLAKDDYYAQDSIVKVYGKGGFLIIRKLSIRDLVKIDN
jgi:hypothetical protein